MGILGSEEKFPAEVKTKGHDERQTRKKLIAMPMLSMFYGIIIYMFSEKGERHHLPHIHCKYSEYEAVKALDGTLLEGSMPASKMKLIDAWMELHQDELAANWELLSNGEKHYRINPLQ